MSQEEERIKSFRDFWMNWKSPNNNEKEYDEMSRKFGKMGANQWLATQMKGISKYKSVEELKKHMEKIYEKPAWIIEREKEKARRDETRGPLKELPVNETEKQREMRMAREDADAAIARAKEKKLKAIAERIKRSSAARKITAIIRKAANKKKLTRAEKELVEDEIGVNPEDLPDIVELSIKDAPQPVDSNKTCAKSPNKPATSVKQTKMVMRGPNPNRKGWRLPRKPYGHEREVVELEDDLTDAEMKRMTSELPRRCLVEAVQKWADENDKLVLPSITRASKAEIVATIKEHRIKVPRMEGGGYYGDGRLPIFKDFEKGRDIYQHLQAEQRRAEARRRAEEAESDRYWASRGMVNRHSREQAREGEQSGNETDDSLRGDGGEFNDWIENERRTTQPYEIVGEGGAEPVDKDLYEKAKAIVYKQYAKPSAYRSGALVKKYKEMGGKFKDEGERKLARWFKEDWKDVAGMDYPVYRPTKRLSKDTPLTPEEIDPENLKEQAILKQKIKGKKNLPPFEGGSGFFESSYSSALANPYFDKLIEEEEERKRKEEKEEKEKNKEFNWFDFLTSVPSGSGNANADDYLAQAKAFAKKAGYENWNNLKYANDGVHKLELDGVKFGRKGYGDFIEYGMKDGAKEAQKHRKAYLARATKMPGEWKDDPMSKNNLAIKVLWGGSPFFHLRGGSAQPALPPNIDLQSKKENPQVEEIIEEPMDDADIRAYYPNAKIMRYSDLAKYKTITQLLPKDKSYAFILYQHAPNNGHWVLLMRYGNTIEFFCSYGSQIDAPLKWTNPRDRQMLGEAVPYLTNLLKAQKEFNVVHNPVQYQSKGSDKATCGAHDVMRLSQMLNHGQDLTDYYDYMSQIKKESGLSYDEIVANFVSQR